jgi:hypothetical protein
MLKIYTILSDYYKDLKISRRYTKDVSYKTKFKKGERK